MKTLSDQLKIEHLTPYLPYYLYVIQNNRKVLLTGIGDVDGRYPPEIYSNRCINCFSVFYRVDEFASGNDLSKNIVPILKPLSELFFPNKNGIEPIVEIAKISYPELSWEIGHNHAVGSEKFRFGFSKEGVEDFNFYLEEFEGKGNCQDFNQLGAFNYLFKNHYDVYDLHSRGLCIYESELKV